MRFALLFVLSLVPLGRAGPSELFTPEHRVSGIGVERDDISSDLLDIRTDRMIQSQTFAIMRDPQALNGAKRMAGNAKLQGLFKNPRGQQGVFAPPALQP